MAEPFAEWVILELLGHRRLAGFLTEATIAGHSYLRLDIPGPDPANTTTPLATQFYAPSSVYAIHPTSEAIARTVAARSEPAPVRRWELEPPVRVELEDEGPF